MLSIERRSGARFGSLGHQHCRASGTGWSASEGGRRRQKQDCRNGAGYCTWVWQGLADSKASKGTAIGDSVNIFFSGAISALEVSIGHANAIYKAISGMIRAITAEQIDGERISCVCMAARKRTERLAQQSADQRERLDNCLSAARWSKERNAMVTVVRLACACNSTALSRSPFMRYARHRSASATTGPCAWPRTITKALWA